jgi:hypothetical protein
MQQINFVFVIFVVVSRILALQCNIFLSVCQSSIKYQIFVLTKRFPDIRHSILLQVNIPCAVVFEFKSMRAH